MNKSIIYLIGLPGSGKTTLGKKIAEELKFQFFDLDKLIEELHQQSIAEIFEKSGEESFRRIEMDVLRVKYKEPTVIATGGGTPCFHDNMEYMMKNGVTIFLNTSIDSIISRMDSSEIMKRPLFQRNDLKNVLLELNKKRLPFYQKAHLEINENMNFKNVVEEVIGLLKSHKKDT